MYMSEFNDISVMDYIDRYFSGQMSTQEKQGFENLRSSNPEFDLLVVEHTLFTSQIEKYCDRYNYVSSLHKVHTDLLEKKEISDNPSRNAKVIYFWNRYKRVAALAAAIAGITVLFINLITSSFSSSDKKLMELKRELTEVKKEQHKQTAVVNKLQGKITLDPSITYKSGGTGFLVDGKGLLVTNAHVVKNARYVAVENKNGESFNVVVVFQDAAKDIALLQINDDNFKALSTIPYSISKQGVKLAEPIYTLGYPKNEIVYGQGYISAKTGYNGDTLNCQIAIAANPGNSGGPVLNKNGEVIGIVSTRQAAADGVVYAVQSKHIFNALDELKLQNDSTYQKIKLPNKSLVAGLNATSQVEKIDDYIFMVKVN